MTDYEAYLKTSYWKNVATKVKERAGYRCQCCNSQLDLIAHHRTYENRGRELEHLSDLICLCQRCHATFHGKIKIETPKPPINPQEVPIKPQRRRKRNAYGEIDHDAIQKDMPPLESDCIILTFDLINRTRTKAGAFTNATLRALNVATPLVQGWPHRMVGKQISRLHYKEALEGRYLYNSGKLR